MIVLFSELLNAEIIGITHHLSQFISGLFKIVMCVWFAVYVCIFVCGRHMYLCVHTHQDLRLMYRLILHFSPPEFVEAGSLH